MITLYDHTLKLNYSNNINLQMTIREQNEDSNNSSITSNHGNSAALQDVEFSYSYMVNVVFSTLLVLAIFTSVVMYYVNRFGVTEVNIVSSFKEDFPVQRLQIPCPNMNNWEMEDSSVFDIFDDKKKKKVIRITSSDYVI